MVQRYMLGLFIEFRISIGGCENWRFLSKAVYSLERVLLQALTEPRSSETTTQQCPPRSRVSSETRVRTARVWSQPGRWD